MLLIGVTGKLGSGKDYITQNIIIPYFKKRNQTILPVSFADQLKVNVMVKNNIPFNDVYIKKNNETRNLLQTEGTENGRVIFGNDIWIRYFDNWIEVFRSRGIETFVTSDLRFRNEFDYIRSKNGILIKVVAPNRNEERLQRESKGDPIIYNKFKTHISECELDDFSNENYDLVIYNDSDSNFDENLKKTHKLLDELNYFSHSRASFLYPRDSYNFTNILRKAE